MRTYDSSLVFVDEISGLSLEEVVLQANSGPTHELQVVSLASLSRYVQKG
jgi:hypothetical protein